MLNNISSAKIFLICRENLFPFLKEYCKLTLFFCGEVRSVS